MVLPGLALLLLQAWPSPPAPPAPELVMQVKALAQQLTAEDPGTRVRAETALLALGPEATEPLIELAKAGEGAQLEAIRAVLPKFGPAAVERLFYAPHRNRLKADKAEDEAAMAVAGMGAAAIPELRKLLDSGRESRQAFAIGVLRSMGPVGVDYLVTLLKHPDRPVRSMAATLLSNLADPRAADAFLEGLRSEDPSVRAGAARGLGGLRDRRAVEPLLQLLGDDNFVVRQDAVGALGRLYEPRFLQPLVGLARNDPAIEVRNTAANVLIKQSHDPVAERLGRRYRPHSTDPVVEEPIRLGVVTRLVLTGLGMYLMLRTGFVLSKAGPSLLGLSATVWCSIAGVASVGFWWGRLALSMTPQQELLLLAACIPMTVLFGWGAGPELRALHVPAWSLVVGWGSVVLVVFPFVGMLGWLILSWLAPRLIVAAMPVAVVVAWWVGRRIEPAVRARFRVVTAVGAIAFYAGYGVGWAALWGYFGA